MTVNHILRNEHIWRARQMFKLIEIGRHFMGFGQGENIIMTYNLRPSEMQALMRIYLMTLDEPHGINLKKFSASARLSQPAASMLISQLVDRGLIKREAHPSDRRQILLTLEAEIHELFSQHLATLGQHIEEQMQGIDQSKLDQLQHFIDEMHAYIKTRTN